MRERPAPSPSRIEISRSRAAARATSRFETLAQAMTRTRPTSAARILSGTSSARRTSEKPCAAGSTTAFEARNWSRLYGETSSKNGSFTSSAMICL